MPILKKMLVELLKDPPAQTPPAGAERRRSRRVPVTMPATLTPVADGKDGSAALELQVRNVSLHGAGLRSAAPLAVDEVYNLDMGPGPLKLHARVRVVASRQRRDGLWDVGVEYF
jgi:hypothetical protein